MQAPIDVAKFANLDRDVILAGELARRYKRDLDCYRHNVALLDRSLATVPMVAAQPRGARRGFHHWDADRVRRSSEGIRWLRPDPPRPAGGLLLARHR